MQEGFALILSGLFKKVVIASYLSEHIVRDVFESPEFYSSWTILAAVYAYSIQIFCDFSGYSDMAIGVGRLMGFRLPENFRSPYLALNIQVLAALAYHPVPMAPRLPVYPAWRGAAGGTAT